MSEPMLRAAWLGNRTIVLAGELEEGPVEGTASLDGMVATPDRAGSWSAIDPAGRPRARRRP